LNQLLSTKFALLNLPQLTGHTIYYQQVN